MCPDTQPQVSYVYLTPAFRGRLNQLRALIAMRYWIVLDVAAREFAAEVSDRAGLMCAIFLLRDVRANLPKGHDGSDGEAELRTALANLPPFSYDE